MKTDYALEEFILASGFNLTPWQTEIISKLEAMDPADRVKVLERPQRGSKSYGYFPTLGN